MRMIHSVTRMVALVLALFAGTSSAQGAGTEEAVQLDGKALFNAQCLACHGAQPWNIGTLALSKRLGKELAVLTDRTDLHPGYVEHVVRQGLNTMPPFRYTEITDNELQAISQYLTQQKER